MEAKLTHSKYDFLAELGIGANNPGVFDGKWKGTGKPYTTLNPTTGEPIANVGMATPAEYKECIAAMDAAKPMWAKVPPPKRGDIVRKIAIALRKHQLALGKLVALEMGKILPEGIGEVQEAIDICDFASGLSRALNGSVIPSERPEHFMMERYLPMNGHVCIITAFNFPCAVYFWNVALSLACGNTNLWKPASSTTLVAIACQKIVSDVLAEAKLPAGICTLCCGGGRDIGALMLEDKKLDLVSFTGSCEIGTRVSSTVAQRFGATILELGGNNAMVVMDDADLELVQRACVFAAVGTAGQRCTTLRRIYVHEKVYDTVVPKLVSAYKNIIANKIGDPLAEGTLCGPLHTTSAVKEFTDGIQWATEQGGKVLVGGKKCDRPGYFVEPTLIEIDHKAKIVQTELFVPILYVLKIGSLEEGIRCNNDVPQGLSSALFTKSMANTMQWVGELGSDCGIVNVNIGPSGAEIGGAFGGNKDTGCGRESGSDAWKQYCRRSTCTINFSDKLPLAQGISFE